MGSLRAAVIGVRGIGKFHAQWYAIHGCDVVAFAGSSPESTAEAEAVLQRNFGFSGQRYWDVDRLLDESRPDLVSVCTPAVLHYEHVRACLEHDVHVLCEKPFVWQDPPEASALLGQCDTLIDLADRRARLLAVNTQYVAMLDAFFELAGRGPDRRFPAEMLWDMEIRDRGYTPLGLLGDTVSHPLSVLIACAGATPVQVRDVRVRWRDRGLVLDFVAVRDGSSCRCRWDFDQVPGPKMARRLSLDGFEASMGYTKEDADGVVHATLSTPDRTLTFPDTMSESIRRFVCACGGEGTPLVDATSARQNLRLHLQLMSAAQAQAS